MTLHPSSSSLTPPPLGWTVWLQAATGDRLDSRRGTLTEKESRALQVCPYMVITALQPRVSSPCPAGETGDGGPERDGQRRIAHDGRERATTL